MYKKKELKPLPSRVIQLNGISERTIREHYKLYEGYVNKTNETRDKLSTLDTSKGNATYSEVRALKRGESYALNGAKLHELYFEQLGGNGKPSGVVMQMIQEQYRNYDKFSSEFKSAGMSARGWAILACDTAANELFIYITDDQHNGHVIETVPILPMDVFEHAYFIDYGTNRSAYIDAFLKNLDWSVINARCSAMQKQKKPQFKLFGR